MADHPNTTNTNQEKDNDYNLYMSENGHLSFENPNYQGGGGGGGGLPSARIDAARMEDHLNSNIQPALPPSVFEELCQVGILFLHFVSKVWLSLNFYIDRVSLI